MFKFYLALSLAICGMSFGQSTEFKLQNSLSNLSNPAFTGISANQRISYGLALENVALSSGSHAHFFGYDTHIDKLHGGIGIQLQTHNSTRGAFNSTRATLNYAYQLQLGDNYTFSAGGGITIHRDHINFEKLTFGDGYQNPKIIYTRPTVYLPEYELGIMLYHKIFFASVQNKSLNYRSFLGDDLSYNLLNIQAGAQLTPFSNKNLSFNPLISFFNEHYGVNNNWQSVIFQLAFHSKYIGIGGQSSIGNGEFAAMLALYIKKFNVKYLSSFWSGNLNPTSSFSHHEVTLTYNFGKDLKRRSQAFEMNLF